MPDLYLDGIAKSLWTPNLPSLFRTLYERHSILTPVEEPACDISSMSFLVNNEGITVVAGILDQTLEDWDKVIETNLHACFLISKLAAQSMVKQRQGKIINLARMYSFFGFGFVPSYSSIFAESLKLGDRNPFVTG
jgi:NAD(P)-dependent dehydrogenase (short-subunit alcohol dehydrogenase family)